MIKVADKWVDYELIDIDQGEKLERWNDIVLIRPDPQVIFKTGRKTDLWRNVHAKYSRSPSGGGSWEYRKKIPDRWIIGYGELKFYVSPTNFKHTGLFPEQAVNWDFFADRIRKSKKKFNILNLFAYTGGATLACAQSGAKVCHVDAAKGMVSWAKENLGLSGLSDKPVRFIVDDALKFVLREQRRGNVYDGIIMDPPSYGRGPRGEIWKNEDNLFELVSESIKLLSEDADFFHINSYTTGFSAIVFEDMLKLTAFEKMQQGKTTAGELVLPVTNNDLCLPCGIYARWTS